MSLADAKTVLTRLKNVGVRIIELTGGDISVYRHLPEVIEYASSLGFDQIALLTNGFKLEKNLIDIIKRNKKHILVQIDLHSIRDDYMSWFTGVDGVASKVMENIKLLNIEGVKLKIVSIITHKNMSQIEEIGNWVYEQGINNLSFSFVIQMGRAMDKELFIDNPEEAKIIEENVTKISEKTSGFAALTDCNNVKQINCGCVASHVVINPNGDVKLCTMDNMSYIDFSLGNVIKTDIKEIFDNNQDLVKAFYELKAPSADLEECKGCKNLHFCFSCVLRGLIMSKEEGNSCGWYDKYVPHIIKKIR